MNRKEIFRTRLYFMQKNVHTHFMQWLSKKDDGMNWDPSFEYDSLVMNIAEKKLKDKPEIQKSETNLAYLNRTKINSNDYNTPDTTFDSTAETKITEDGIPLDLLQRMQRKQDSIQEKKNEITKQYKLDEDSKKAQTMLKITDSVKQLFAMQPNISTLGLQKVLQFLKTTQGIHF